MAVTDYLRGAGTSTDPYIIHNVAAWTQFFNVDKNSGKYFEVIADIDCAGVTLAGVGYFSGRLNGNGFKVLNFSSASNYWLNSSSTGVIAEVNNIHISATYTGINYPLSSSSSTKMTWSNVRFDLVLSNSSGKVFYRMDTASSTFNNVLITFYGTQTFSSIVSTNTFSTCYVIAPNTSSFGITGVTRLSGTATILPASYPSLGSVWIIDSVSIPYLAKNGRASLTQKYAIKGTTKVAGEGKSRDIVILTSAYFGVFKQIKSGSNGLYLIDMADVYDPVYVMHYDDYGFPLFANTAYVIGAYIHPKTPNGYRYKCTTAGTSAGTLPTDPWTTSSNLISGTAIFSPEPVYAAETFLVSPHLYDFLTGQPV